MNGPWYLSKTKWGAILGGLVMFFTHICTEGQLCFVPDLVLALMGSVAAILLGTGLRDAISKNGQGK